MTIEVDTGRVCRFCSGRIVMLTERNFRYAGLFSAGYWNVEQRIYCKGCRVAFEGLPPAESPR